MQVPSQAVQGERCRASTGHSRQVSSLTWWAGGQSREAAGAQVPLKGCAAAVEYARGLPGYSPRLAHQPGAYGAGAGRSVRGLPILWESPSPGALRGQKWKLSPGAVRAEGAPSKRRGSALADERLAKRRHEST